MFKFLKNLFKKEIERQDIPIADLDRWFESKTEHVFGEINNLIKERFSEINGLLSEFKESTHVLENAEIKDPEKIESRVKNIVLGHRVNYIRMLNHFLDTIAIPTEISYKTGMAFCSQIEDSLNDFSKTTIKSYYTVQHLFAAEVEGLVKNIKKLDMLIKGLKEDIEKSNVVRVERTKGLIQKLRDAINKKELLEKQLEEEKARLVETEKAKEEIEKRLANLKQSKEFLELDKKKEGLDSIGHDLLAVRSGIIELFSPLETGLKKFERITLEDEELINEYIGAPMRALLKDKELKIIGLLQNMKKSILSGGIELKDKKKKRTLGRIDELTREELDKKVSLYVDLKNKKNELEKQIKEDKAASEIKDLDYKLEHNERILKRLKGGLIGVEKDKERIDIDRIKAELEEELKEVTEVEVNIII